MVGEAILTWIGSLLLGVASAFGYTRTKLKTFDRDLKEVKDEIKECQKSCIKVPEFNQFEQRFEEVVGGVQASVETLQGSNEMILKELLCIKSKLK